MKHCEEKKKEEGKRKYWEENTSGRPVFLHPFHQVIVRDD